jgi:hypothetical protein
MGPAPMMATFFPVSGSHSGSQGICSIKIRCKSFEVHDADGLFN